MVSIPKEVQEFFAGKMGWVAIPLLMGKRTSHPRGRCRCAAASSSYSATFLAGDPANLEQNPRVAVTVIDPGAAKGYQVKGTAELLTSGPLFDKLVAQIKEKGIGMPLVRGENPRGGGLRSVRRPGSGQADRVMVGAAGSNAFIGVCQSGTAEAISAHRLLSAIQKPRGTHTVVAGNAVGHETGTSPTLANRARGDH